MWPEGAQAPHLSFAWRGLLLATSTCGCTLEWARGLPATLILFAATLLAQISSKEEPRHYSAKIAWNARNNSHMPLLATGAPAINCAIKV